MPRRIPYIAQLEMADCSAACLAMTLAYHGRHVGLDELRDATGVGRGGADARGIVEAAHAYGLSARGVKADVHELGHLPRGSILHWQFRHFVVLDRVARRGIHVLDPVAGRAYIPRELFGRAYTGVAIALEPGPDWEAGGRRAKANLRYLRPMLREARLVRFVLATSILLRLFALALPLFTAVLVNRILPGGESHLLLVLTAGMLAIAAYYLFAAFLRARLLLTLRTKLDMQLTLGFVEHLVDLPYAFFLKRSGGDLAMRLQSNAEVREILTTGALSAVLDGAFACIYVVALLVLSPSMGLLVFGLGVLQVAVLVLARRRNQRLMAESLHVQARSQSYVYQLLGGIEDLKAAGAERRASAHWSNLFVDQINVSLARGRLEALTESATAGLGVASPLAVLAVGGAQVLNGGLSVGEMLALAALSAGFLAPLATLVTTGLQLQLLGSYMQRINDVLDAPKEQQDRHVRRAPTLSGRIAAEGVSFRYSRLAPLVVEDVSLEVERGGRWRSSGAPARARRPWVACCSASIDRNRAASSTTASILPSSRRGRSVVSSESSPSGRTCSGRPSGTTSRSPTQVWIWTPSSARRNSRALTTTSRRCGWPMRRSWSTGALRCRAVRGSGSRLPAPSPTLPRSSSSTRRRASWTLLPSAPSTTTSPA